MKKKNRKKNVILAAVLIIVLLGIGGFGINYWLRNEKYQKAIRNTSINEVDLSTVEDGDYIGEYDVDFISAKVKVTIKDHTITNIEYLHHKNERGAKANVISENIIKQQSIKVDTISGATNSSKVIQKAVERALVKE